MAKIRLNVSQYPCADKSGNAKLMFFTILAGISFPSAVGFSYQRELKVLPKHFVTVQHGRGQIDARLDIKSDVVLRPGFTAASLAAAITKVTGKTTIVILPQKQRYLSEIAKDTRNGVITWKNLQLALRRAGAMHIAFVKQGVTAIIQGRAYPAAQKAASPCDNRELVIGLLGAYQRLTSEDKRALISRQGLLLTGDLQKATEGRKALVDFIDFPFPERTQPTRLRVRLRPAVDSIFLDAPQKMTTGWWRWENESEHPPKFPKQILISQPAQYGDWPRSLIFRTGIINAQNLSSELARVTGMQVKVNKEIVWPEVGFAGDTISANVLLQCLNIATVADTRVLAKQKLIFISNPKNVGMVTRPPSMTISEQRTYHSILREVSQNNSVDLGPLSSSILQIPLSSLPVSWSRTLLTDVAPIEALVQAGVVEESAESHGHAQVESAFIRWNKTYSNSSLTSLASLSLLSEQEVETIKDQWDALEASSTNLPTQCW